MALSIGTFVFAVNSASSEVSSNVSNVINCPIINCTELRSGDSKEFWSKFRESVTRDQNDQDDSDPSATSNEETQHT
ncbi:MAG: hypothetical protein IJ797_07515 [Selenomonadaceae bacterium]|nr:hypothetical protein [Selenomonadaceae bacterium]